MALGKAFIEVHADTRPFARELGRELGRILRVVETTPARRIGERLGAGVADGVADGVRAGRRRITRGFDDAFDEGGIMGFASRFARGIVDTIDDGLSGLPAEAKIAVAGILAALAPVIGAGIAGAIAGGLILGFGGLGIFIAAQFQVVREFFAEVVTDLRAMFLGIGDVFVLPVLRALAVLREEFIELGPAFERVFALASTFIEPITDALIVFVESLLPHLETSLENVYDFLPQLIDSFEILGEALGFFLTIVTGADDAGEGLLALSFIIGTLIAATGILIRVLTEMFGILYDIFLLITGQEDTVERIFTGGEKSARKFAKQNIELANAVGFGTASFTMQEEAIKKQMAAIEAANSVLSEYVNTTLGAWDANIAFEQSLDDMSEQLRKHRGNLNLDTQAGRDNQESIKKGITQLLRQREETIALTGDTAAANATFATNRKRLEDAAVAAGISRTKFNELTAAITGIPAVNTNIVPLALLSRLAQLVRLGLTARSAFAAAVIGVGIASAAGKRIPQYAEGTIATKPTLGVFGEAGPEAVIPLNNPARAMQLMNQSGLSSMVSPVVNVYVGNQQLDSYIDTRVDRRMTTTARGLAYGSRSI